MSKRLRARMTISIAPELKEYLDKMRGPVPRSTVIGFLVEALRQNDEQGGGK